MRARLAVGLALWMLLALGAVVALPASARATPVRAMAADLRSLPTFQDAGSDPSTIVARLRSEQQQSIDRALAGVAAHFDAYRDRSGAFARDLLRWSTRGRLAWGSMRDVVGRASQQRHALVRERFEANVVSEAELRAVVLEAAERLALELRADRARALARVRARVTLDPMQAQDSDRWSEQVGQLGDRMDRALLRQADRSLVMAVATVIGATIVTEVVAAAVGSALTGAAAGAAGGSIVPGAGTVVGFATGLAAGVAVDWWMSAEVERDLTLRSTQTIDALRGRIIEGDLEHGTRGLRAIFQEMAEREARAFDAPLQQWMEKRP